MGAQQLQHPLSRRTQLVPPLRRMVRFLLRFGLLSIL